MNKKDKTFYMITIFLFLVLNILNTFLITTGYFNPGMNLYKNDFFAVVASILGNMGVLAIFLALINFIFKNERSKVVAMAVVTTALSGIIFMFSVYTYYFTTAFSFFNIKILGNDADVLAQQLTVHMLKNLFKLKKHLALIPILIMIGLVTHMYGWRFLKKNKQVQTKRNIKGAFITLLVGVLTLGASTVNFKMVEKQSPLNEVEALKGFQTLGVYPYMFKDLVSFTTSYLKTEELDAELRERTETYLNNFKDKNNLTYFGESTTNSDPIFKDKNLIILQLESFNNFLINLEITDPKTGISYEITPFMNSLVNNEDNLYYNNFYSNIGVGKTSDAEFSTNTGLNSTGEVVSYYDYINDEYETIAKLFNKEGYRSSIFTGSTLDFYHRHLVYPDLGFKEENYYNRERYQEMGVFNPKKLYDLDDGTQVPHDINGWVNDHIVYDQLVNVLKTNPSKQYIFVESTVQHSPFAYNKYINGIHDWSCIIPSEMGRFLEYASYADKALSHFFELLENENLLDDTVIMMYGDHKSDLNIDEHQHLEQFKDMNTTTYNQVIHNIPFVLVAQGHDLSAYKSSTSLVRGQSDIKRTVTNLFGLDAKYYLGVDILSNNKTFAYVPLSKDFFTDEFHLNIRSGKIYYYDPSYELSINDYKQVLNDFLIIKENNDFLLKYKFFTD